MKRIRLWNTKPFSHLTSTTEDAWYIGLDGCIGNDLSLYIGSFISVPTRLYNLTMLELKRKFQRNYKND